MAEEGVGKKYYGMMDAAGKLGEFQSRLQNSSADEITAGNFAIPTIEGWLDTDTLGPAQFPFRKTIPARKFRSLSTNAGGTVPVACYFMFDIRYYYYNVWIFFYFYVRVNL